MTIVPLLLLVEYLPHEFTYGVIRWSRAAAGLPVMARPAARDFAIAEWPAGHRVPPPATYGMWSPAPR